MNATTVLDHDGLLEVFRQLCGRRFIGPADGINCVELVFESGGNDAGNLVSIFTDGVHRGQVAFGFVAQELIEEGYGSPEDGE
jgi:hypothetical protein